MNARKAMNEWMRFISTGPDDTLGAFSNGLLLAFYHPEYAAAISAESERMCDPAELEQLKEILEDLTRRWPIEEGAPA